MKSIVKWIYFYISNMFRLVNRKYYGIAGLLSLLISILFLFNSISCKSGKTKEQKPIDNEKLIGFNKELIQDEQVQIEDYIKRHGYVMQSTETGLHYKIQSEGEGQRPVFQSSVSIKYRVNFLDGSYCYSSDSSGVLKFVLGQSDEPSGLQEGLLKLKEGGKAIFIVPSYLAYGLTGDGNKIGQSQTLVYHVELLKIEQ